MAAKGLAHRLGEKHALLLDGGGLLVLHAREAGPRRQPARRLQVVLAASLGREQFGLKQSLGLTCRRTLLLLESDRDGDRVLDLGAALVGDGLCAMAERGDRQALGTTGRARVLGGNSPWGSGW